MKTFLFSLLALALSSSFAHADEKLVCSNSGKAEISKKFAKDEEKFLDKIKLTKDQKTKINHIRQDNEDRIFTQVKKVRAAHVELMNAIEKDAAKDLVQADLALLEREKLNLLNIKVDSIYAIREILSPDQRKKVIAAIKTNANAFCE